jgi:heme o synthase
VSSVIHHGLDILRVFATLTKARIASLSTLTAATGYLAYARTIEPGLIVSCLGVLLLAFGTCALNQFQERRIDARMERTRGRPIPSGVIAPGTALAVALLLIASGALVLLTRGPVPAAIGLLAPITYNGGYTYLKRVTPFAAVPGAIIGALPPAIGFASAGGEAGDPRMLALCLFFFLWQVPHFWLLLFSIGEDYRRAGLPVMTDLFSRRQLARLVSIWMLATAASSLMLPVFDLAAALPARFGLVALALWLALRARRLLSLPEEERLAFRMAFRGINLYAVLVMAMVVVDTVW